MPRHIGSARLLAGGAAVVVLVVLVFVLRLNPVLATLFAVAVYAGLELLEPPAPESRYRKWWPFGGRSGETDEAIAFKSAVSHAETIAVLTAQIPSPRVRGHLDRILARTEQILVVMRTDNDVTAAPILDALILEPLAALITEYHPIATRGVAGAGDLLAKVETVDLPLIEQAVDDFYEHLHQRQMIDLAILSDMLQVNLESVRATMRRRRAS